MPREGKAQVGGSLELVSRPSLPAALYFSGRRPRRPPSLLALGFSSEGTEICSLPQSGRGLPGLAGP